MGNTFQVSVFKEVSSDYVMKDFDTNVQVTANSVKITPPSAEIQAPPITIKNEGSDIVTVDAVGSETINGDLTVSLNQYEYIELISDGSNYTGEIKSTKNKQSEETAAFTVKKSDNNSLIFLNSATAFDVTIDNDLDYAHRNEFINDGLGVTTFVSGTATLSTPDGAMLLNGERAVLIRKKGDNDYRLYKI